MRKSRTVNSDLLLRLSASNPFEGLSTGHRAAGFLAGADRVPSVRGTWTYSDLALVARTSGVIFLALLKSDANPHSDESLSSGRLLNLLARVIGDALSCRALADQDFYERRRPGQRLHKFVDAGLARIPLGLYSRWSEPL